MSIMASLCHKYGQEPIRLRRFASGSAVRPSPRQRNPLAAEFGVDQMDLGFDRAAARAFWGPNPLVAVGLAERAGARGTISGSVKCGSVRCALRQDGVTPCGCTTNCHRSSGGSEAASFLLDSGRRSGLSRTLSSFSFLTPLAISPVAKHDRWSVAGQALFNNLAAG